MPWLLSISWLLLTAPISPASPDLGSNPERPNLKLAIHGQPKSERAFYIECATTGIPFDSPRGIDTHCHTTVVLKDGQVYHMEAGAHARGEDPVQLEQQTSLRMAVHAIDATHVRLTAEMIFRRTGPDKCDTDTFRATRTVELGKVDEMALTSPSSRRRMVAKLIVVDSKTSESINPTK